MSFRVSLHAVPYVRSYDEALAFHAKAAKKPWRKGKLPSRAAYYPNYYTDHALPGKRSRNCGVRMMGDNVVFRLHSTEVITWRPDGSVRVNVYHSQSTCVFINNFIPNHLMISMHSNGYVLRDLRTLDAIPLRDDFTIFADGTIGETDPAVFALQRINKPAAKRLREEVGYTAFAKWRKIMEPLLVGQHDWREQWNADSELSRMGYVSALKDQEMWPKFVIAGRDNQNILAHLYTGHSWDIYRVDYVDNLKWRVDGRYVNLSRYRIMRRA